MAVKPMAVAEKSRGMEGLGFNDSRKTAQRTARPRSPAKVMRTESVSQRQSAREMVARKSLKLKPSEDFQRRMAQTARAAQARRAVQSPSRRWRRPVSGGTSGGDVRGRCTIRGPERAPG